MIFGVEFQFLRPWLLALLIVPVFFSGIGLRAGHTGGSWQKICNPALLEYLLVQGRGTRRRLIRFVLCLSLTLGIIAAAGPALKNGTQPVINTLRPVMFVLNLSSDMKQTDVAPTRLDRAKLELNAVLNGLKESETGLIVYADEPFVISPLSKDPRMIANLLDSVDTDIMPVNGDRPERALALAVERMKAAGFATGEIVLLTPEAGMNPTATVQAARQAADAGMTVNVVGLTTSDSQGLEQIAADGKGLYLPYADRVAEKMNEKLERRGADQAQSDTDELLMWRDYGYYVLLACLACFSLLFRYKGLYILVLIGLSTEAQAGLIWSDSKEASNAFEQGDYATAAEKFKDSSWQGAALYRAANYDAAVQAFDGAAGTEALYNKANALAKAGRIDEAVKTYETVLAQQPDHEDARYNLEYLKQNQQQNESQSQNSDSDQNKREQTDSQSQSQNDTRQDSNENASQSQKGNQDQNQENGAETKAQQQNGDSDGSRQNGKNDSNDGQPDDSSQGKDRSQEQAQNQQSQESAQNAAQVSDDQSEQTKDENGQNSAQTEAAAQARPSQDEAQDNTDQAQAVAQGQDDQPYDEQAQARAQRVREIPEDRGGLLRAFIQKEYRKNRYGAVK